MNNKRDSSVFAANNKKRNSVGPAILNKISCPSIDSNTRDSFESTTTTETAIGRILGTLIIHFLLITIYSCCKNQTFIK